MPRVMSVCLAVAALAVPCFAQDGPPEGFTPLFDGKNLDGFRFVLKEEGDPADTWSVKDGVIACTGSPAGYFHTAKSYQNYTLRYDWRFPRPGDLMDDALFVGNTGVFLHIQGEPVVWPKCVEVQGMYREHGNVFGLGVKLPEEADFDKEAQQEALAPVGEWNTTEITCQGGKITVKLNGTEVCTATSPLSQGPIGWQSEGSEVHFRNIYIKDNQKED